MWLCRGNGAQVHHSERDPETRTAACETQVGARAFYVSLFLSFERFMWRFPVLGNQSGSVQYQHRRTLCHPQRIYPFTILQVSLLTGGSALSFQHQWHVVSVNNRTMISLMLMLLFCWLLFKCFLLLIGTSKLKYIYCTYIRNSIYIVFHLHQTPAGESTRQKSGHHRVHPLPISLQGDAHQGFLQTVWGNLIKLDRI